MASKLLGIALLLVANALAGEYAVFTSGFRLRVNRHETEGPNIRLYANGGYTDVQAADVARFEQEDYVPPAPRAAAPQKPAPSLQELVSQAAGRYGLPPEFLSSVARAESGLRAGAVSPKGAIGIMQLMPETARLLGADPNDPQQNVDAGARYLTDLLLKYNGSTFKALAAYNAGPGAVERYHGIPPYQETVRYIERVVKQYNASQSR